MKPLSRDVAMIRITEVGWFCSALVALVCMFRETFAEWTVVFESIFIFASQVGFTAGSVGLFYFRYTSLSHAMRTCVVLNGILVALYFSYDLITFLLASR